MSLFVFTVRTTPGLALLAVGAGITLTGRSWGRSGRRRRRWLVYRVQCFRTPYTDCWRCGGVGYRPPRHRRHALARLLFGASQVRRCRAGRGRGVRMRWGKRVMNAYRRATHTSTTTLGPVPEPPPVEAGPVS